MRRISYKRILLTLLTAVTALLLPPASNADVYRDKLLGEEQVSSLTALLPKSIAPGGTRKVTINTSPMTITRSLTQSERDIANALDMYLSKWSQPGTNAPMDYSLLDRMVDDRERYTASDAVDEAMDLLGREREKIISTLEQPVRYKVGPWTVISRIPISAIQPDNELADTAVTEGFIVFVDSKPDDTGYYGAWEISFVEGFNLMNIVGQHSGDAPGYNPFDITPLPGSRRTMTYEEEAHGWHSVTWSYEAAGTVESNLAFYVTAMEELGFAQRGPTIERAGEKLVQMAKGDVSIVIYALNTMSSTRPIQITIQRLA